MSSPALAILVHWLHLMGAITALGGIIFLLLAVLPASSQILSDEIRPLFDRALRKRITMIVHGSVLVLIITGLVNLSTASRGFPEHMSALYVMVFGAKFILAIFLFGIAIALTISSEAMAKFHARRKFWLSMNALLGLAIVLLSAWLRHIPRG